MCALFCIDAPHSSKVSGLSALKLSRIAAASAKKRSSGGAKKTLTKSRSKGLQKLMDGDKYTGDDMYADLEDFIVEDHVED